MTDLQLYKELTSLPAELKAEVERFIQVLKSKIPAQPSLEKRKFGGAKGYIKMSADFEEPLKEFKDYM